MSVFLGTKRLVRLALRRDRIVLPVTISLVLLMVAGGAPALTSSYPDYATQLSYIASSVPSVVGRLFQGTVQGVDIGSILMAETFLFTAVIMAIMSIFIVSRHTRHNEETGAGELIGSMQVSRSSPLTAALIVAVGANLLIGLILFAALASMKEFSAAGSAYMSLSLAMVGIFFAGVSAITVQLSDYRRGANGMAIGAVVAFFIVRGLGDALGDITADGLGVTASWITWLSPLGWGYQVLPFTDNRIFPIFMLLIGFLIAIGIGYFLLSKRDIGSSIFQTRPGLARAKKSLLSPFGLASRLQLGSLIGWVTGFILSGALMAVVADDFREAFEDNEAFEALLGAAGETSNFTETIIAAMFPLMAGMLAGYVVTALSKMQTEEASGRIEYLLGTALGKVRWFFSHVSFTAIGIIVSLALMGAAGGLAYVLADGADGVGVTDFLLAGLVSIPAMLLFMSVILVVFAMVGRFVKSFAWTFYGYCALIGSLAGIFTWPQWTMNFSPFAHTPPYPSADFEWMPIFIMLGLSVVLTGLAADLFRRRDLSLK